MNSIIKSIATATAVALLFSGSAFAQKGAKEPASDARERIEYIQKSLDGGEGSARLWWWSWFGIYGAATAGSFTYAALTDSKAKRVTYMVSGVTSALGFAGLLVPPMAAAFAPGSMRGLPEGNPEDIRKKLLSGENYLKESAEGEEFGRSWVMHALNFAVNGTAALVMWKGYGDTYRKEGKNPGKEALVNSILGFIVGEIQIFTQPARAIGDWDAYQKKYGKPAGADRGSDVRFFLVSRGDGLGMGAVMTF